MSDTKRALMYGFLILVVACLPLLVSVFDALGQ